MRYLEGLSRYVGRAVRLAGSAFRRLCERACAWWDWHWTRIAEEYGYAEALIAVVVAAAELLSDSPRIRYLVHELIAIYVAVLRTLRHSRLGKDPA